jgi:aspartyl-tRNA(Asn)/glutamyl-tRNA(Gln) amidotransferase subunit C
LPGFRRPLSVALPKSGGAFDILGQSPLGAKSLMSLTREEVKKVSLLARLLLSEDELDAMTVQLGQVLDYVQQLEELNTDGVEPMAHAIDLANVLADDVLEPSLDREAALANAPKRDAECYRVPAVLGE